MPLPLLSKILKSVASKKTKKEKLAVLRHHAPNNAMKQLLKLCYDDNVVWLLPRGTPPYRKNNDLDDSDNGLYQEARKLYLYLEGGNPNLHQVRREALFIQVLESIHADEAELLVQIKDRKIKGITKKLVQEAFPGLL